MKPTPETSFPASAAWRQMGVWVALLALFGLSACGSSYHREWREAAAAYAASDETKPAVTGAWEATWQSDHNGHTGDLWCLVEDIEDEVAGEDLHAFRYYATWGRLLRGGFTAEFPVVKKPGASAFQVSGESDLGPFGTFTHEGMIEGESFEASYQAAESDHGTFTLSRPSQ